ncbi:MAG: hypothetical protein EBX52_11075 [Proteobacteria bacterium]|nr:hypothetical protein [Pseudomonadota bacterium]
MGFVLVLIALFAGTVAQAGSRASKKLGLGIGLVTEPFPSVLGFNASYNFMNQLRLTAGYGSISATGAGYNMDVKTYALDAKLFLLDWSFAPFVSLGYSIVSGTVAGNGTTSGISLAGTGSSANFGLGVDWQTWVGFNFGLEYKSLIGTSVGSVGAPGIYLGWFF